MSGWSKVRAGINAQRFISRTQHAVKNKARDVTINFAFGNYTLTPLRLLRLSVAGGTLIGLAVLYFLANLLGYLSTALIVAILAVALLGSVCTFFWHLASHYPRLPARCVESSIGGVTVRMLDCPAVQIYYPCASSARSSRAAWFRPTAIDQLAEQLWLPSAAFRFLGRGTAPFTQNAPLDDTAQLPVVLFSHGYLASPDVYHVLCSEMAADGYIVVSIEHEDGTGLFAQHLNGEPVAAFPNPTKFNFTRQSVVQWRKPVLDKRIAELRAVVQALHSNSLQTDANPVLRKLGQQIDLKAGIFLVGHSFGSAAIVQFAEQCEKTALVGVQGTLLLDIWPYPLPEETTAAGLSSSPSLFISSDSFWQQDDVGPVVEELVQNSSASIGFRIPNIAHQSFSDTPCLAPASFGRLAGFCGGCDSDLAYSILLSAILQFMACCKTCDKTPANDVATLKKQFLESPLFETCTFTEE